MKRFYIVVFSILILSTSQKDKNMKKVSKQIKATFDIENFQFLEIKVEDSIRNKIWSEFNFNKFNKIIYKNELIGYSYESKAPSMHFEFDYLIILGLDLKVISSKVLVYRENWGGEIGSNRWLRQFQERGKDDRLKYRKDISAISGATISVKSMIETVNLFLESINVLNQKSII